MKIRNLSIVLVLVLFFSGCVVYSFYPLYTEKDLFPNDLLTGEWNNDENSSGEIWIFEHPYKGDKKHGILDSTSYELTIKTVGEEEEKESLFTVHVIELGGNLFLDFYLEDLNTDDVDLGTLHVVPVHTFAKVEVKNDSLNINWFDHDWLSDLIEENKIRIHHEKNDDYILLTAKPRELQKFVTKYVNSEEAFKDGLEANLVRIK